MNTKILDEVMKAYADCNEQYPFGERNLNFKASEAVSVEEAVKIMAKALGEDKSYNAFVPKSLKMLPPTAKVTIARESSVCMYIGELPVSSGVAKRMKANEHSEEGGQTRLWWD